MQRVFSIFMIMILLAGATLASGCAVYDVAVEERNVSDWAGDEKITFLIKEQFLKDDSIKYMDFDAASYEGQVYLIGEYESRSQVDRAVAIAKGIKGVRTVTTYMLPKQVEDHCGTTDNLEIYTRVKHKLISDGDIWSTNIDIKTIQCNVVLLGLVGSNTERVKAIAHASSVPGVRKVRSYIKVK
ncbi:MAG: BON domain-containing protein [Pseudodesulfovibrio sp.]|nr:BON domain-containing protein [Pseudodesulfovibrio sp.]